MQKKHLLTILRQSVHTARQSRQCMQVIGRWLLQSLFELSDGLVRHQIGLRCLIPSFE